VTFGASSGGSVSSNVTVEFPKATANWGTISHAALMDAATGGNMLFHDALSSSREIKTNDIFKFDTGDITNSID
jgi:hypothetical protein